MQSAFRPWKDKVLESAGVLYVTNQGNQSCQLTGQEHEKLETLSIQHIVCFSTTTGTVSAITTYMITV